MGFAKKLAMQQQEQGWAFSSEDVCVNCVDDYALEAAIRTDEEADATCRFCGHDGAAPLDSLVEAFVNGLSVEYADPDNEGVFWDGREGGYQWETKDTWDLIDEYSHVFVNEAVQDAVTRAIEPKLWVEKDFIYRRRDEVLLDSWERFCEIVKHKTRYVFWLTPHEEHEDERYGEVPASTILNKLGEFIQTVNLTEDIPAGTRIWRARTHSEPIAGLAKNLGTVPANLATQANRMNPAGIPMFYGAKDPEHAIREVQAIKAERHVTIAQFEITRSCNIVNLADLPPVPSVFDPKQGPMWRRFRFLHMFAEQLSLPTEQTREQIDYVPTQILTEYLLHVLKLDRKIEGLSFRSALDSEVNIVLNVTNDRCVDEAGELDSDDRISLKIVADSVETRSTRRSEPTT